MEKTLPEVRIEGRRGRVLTQGEEYHRTGLEYRHRIFRYQTFNDFAMSSFLRVEIKNHPNPMVKNLVPGLRSILRVSRRDDPSGAETGSGVQLPGSEGKL